MKLNSKKNKKRKYGLSFKTRQRRGRICIKVVHLLIYFWACSNILEQSYQCPKMKTAFLFKAEEFFLT